jgi:hypothetical protein
VTLEQSPTFFIARAPSLALDPVALLPRAIWRVATLRDIGLEAQAIGRRKQLEAIVEALCRVIGIELTCRASSP